MDMGMQAEGRIPDAAVERAARLRELRGEERKTLVEFLLELAELDRLREYEAFGCATIWDFCREHLALRDGCAGRRIASARVIQRFPIAVDYLRDLRLGMTALSLLQDVLTEGNVRELFDLSAGRSTREVEALAASRRAPEAEPKTSATIRRVETAAIRARPPALRVVEPSGPGGLFQGPPPAPEAAATPAAESESISAAAPPEERYSISLRVGRDFMELLEKARVAASHVVPDGDVAAVLRRGLEEIVRNAEKKERGPERAERSARKAKGSATPAPKSSRRRPHLPIELERFVRQRDQGRCQWKKPGGGICGSQWRTEIDHVVPEAKGGKSTPENTRLLCARHNDQHARDCFGEAFMAARKRRRESGGEPAASSDESGRL